MRCGHNHVHQPCKTRSIYHAKLITAKTQISLAKIIKFELEIKGHQAWYATHRLQHAKYQKHTLRDKKRSLIEQSYGEKGGGKMLKMA